ncbi:MAG: dihydrofolate reductase family protein [Spirochaetaceae bacterium]|nr:dihydrofolate reductase family protein [Spirochaetaceae bacterium]
MAALYGGTSWHASSGLLHVASIAWPSRRVIAIGPAAPPSETDRFVLGFARARADVVVTTGAILRAEPELTHAYAEESGLAAAFAAWRRVTLERERPPRVVVLSASGGLPRDSRALRGAAECLVWTGRAGARRLAQDGPSGVAIAIDEALDLEPQQSLARLLRWLFAEAGAETVLLEAGATTTSALYSRAGAPEVDELLLSGFEGPLRSEAEGPPFASAAAVERVLGAPRSEAHVDEPSGPWRFQRYRRGARAIRHSEGPSGIRISSSSSNPWRV